jgi:hypothetical protein
MDARVRRAALATAMKVTLTSSLLGCGGNTSDSGQRTSAGQPALPVPGAAGALASTGGSVSGSGGSASEPLPVAAGGSTAEPSPLSGGRAGMASTSEGGAPESSTQGGTGAGSRPDESAGAAGSLAGEGGAAAGSACAPEVLDCVDSLEELGLSAGAPLPDVPGAKECCQAVASVAGDVPANECQTELKPRFTPLRSTCCSALLWKGPGCIAWGPPVPPELSLDALRAWSHAA